MRFYPKKTLVLTGKILISALVIWFLTHTSQLKFDLLLDTLHRPFLLLSVILILLSVVVIGAWRWYTLNTTQEISLSFVYTVLLTYMGIAFNYVLPGAIGGDFVRLYSLFKRVPNKKSSIVFTVLFDRVIGLMGVFFIICFIALTNVSIFSQQQALFYLLLFSTGFCVAGLILFVVLLMFPQRIGLSRVFKERFPHNRLVKALISFFDALHLYRNAKLAILKCLAISIVAQILMVAAVAIIANIMNFPPIPFVDYAIAMGITQIVNLIPVAPGGFGVGELAFAKVLVILNPGIGGAIATIFLAYRLISILTYLPGVIGCLPIMAMRESQSRDAMNEGV